MKHKACPSNITALILLCMEHPVIFFDGVCNLCNATVQFIIKHDPGALFRFAALQSDVAKRLPAAKQSQMKGQDSIILLENGIIYTRSTAALRIARKLNAAWPLLYVFMLVPGFIRDRLYNLVARNRYRIWGKQDSCMMPAAELQSRFLS